VNAVRIPVFVASWQIECCWEPPALGDLIAWHLAFVEESEQVDFRRGLVQLEVTASSFDTPEPFEGRWALQLDAPLLSLYWMAARRAVGLQRLTGLIHEDHHAEVPETLPATYGIVRRIQVEECTFVSSASDATTWVPASVAPTYRDVKVSPKWFRHGSLTGAETRSETGVLVEIDVVEQGAAGTSH
jgi:hypothetical protein